MRKTKGAQCKYGAILVCIFFYVQREFPTFGKLNWKSNRLGIEKINDLIEQFGNNFDSILSSYFEEFKKVMKGRMRIPVSLVEKYVQDICFLVDEDYTYIQDIVPRVRWLRPLPYEIDIDDALAAITTLLAKELDKGAPYFGVYDIVKSRVNTDLKIASSVKKKDKIVKKLKSQLSIKDDEENEE